MLDGEEVYSVPTKPTAQCKLDPSVEASSRAGSTRAARRGKHKRPQRHRARYGGRLLSVEATQVLICRSIARAQFPHHLEIISYPSLRRDTSSVEGYEGAEGRGEGTSLCQSPTTLHLVLQLILSSKQPQEDGQEICLPLTPTPTLTFNPTDKPSPCMKLGNQQQSWN